MYISPQPTDHRDLHSFPTRRSSDLREVCKHTRIVRVLAHHLSGERERERRLAEVVLEPGESVLDPRCVGHRIDRRSEEHTSELQSHGNLVCRLLLEKKKKTPLQVSP